MRQAAWREYRFDPAEHEQELRELIEELASLTRFEKAEVDRVLRRHPKGGRSIFSRSEIIAGHRYLSEKLSWPPERDQLIEKLRMKPVRSLSGVTPVTILTKPYPCPGKCIFCPNDVRMPKSYLEREPGAQRAAMHQFDPYDQTFSRLSALYTIGHPFDKVELIVLGGTWSSYPEAYQIWFLTRAFQAMNDFGRGKRRLPDAALPRVDFERMTVRVDGRFTSNPYNEIVGDFLRREDEGGAIADQEAAVWDTLESVQRQNETAGARCVGLSLETRPDHVSEPEVRRLRRLGATKIQIGYQSLSDEILEANQRGHDVAATRRAMRLLRGAGFKVQAHWMPNLYRATPTGDLEDYRRIFDDPDFRPDELKLYPCSLIESAELMRHYESGAWRPYEHEELLELTVGCLTATPPYCRLTRVIRDIPGDDILVGNKITNFRMLVEEELVRRGLRSRDIRAREVKGDRPPLSALDLSTESFRTSVGDELFFQYVTPEDRLAGFLRLCLPEGDGPMEELAGSAIIREVHVYGSALEIGRKDGGKVQHRGLGRKLIDEAAARSKARGFRNLAVISSVGTREYYRRLGFEDGELYQHRRL